MLEQLRREVFAPGQEIFREGEEGHCAYLIEEGCVEVCIGLEADQRRVGLLGKGELIGEVALVDRQPRTATVRACEESVLVLIRRDLVDELLEKTDPVIRHLLRVVLERFRTAQTGSLQHPADEPARKEEYPRPKDSLHVTAARNLALAEDMIYALVADQFEMYYQPICTLTDGRVAGYEALIRWHHPRQGLIAPLEFLWLAEQTGQIRAIGLWALDRACREWPKLRPQTAGEKPFISVNLSANQLTSEGFIDEMRMVLDRYGMAPTELKMELTETIIIARPDIASRVLNAIVTLGGALALDDFGTGYASLDYLQRYPIGTLKIDRAFIVPLLEAPQSEEIVRKTIELAHSLGMDVVAEGIENEAVRRKLLELGCDYGQGWLFGKAAPAPAA